jgi:hypothetical protein
VPVAEMFQTIPKLIVSVCFLACGPSFLEVAAAASLNCGAYPQNDCYYTLWRLSVSSPDFILGQ